MGIRLHRAIGWGLAYEDFFVHTQLRPDDDDVLEALHDTMRFGDFRVPEHVRRTSSNDPRVMSITQSDLLDFPGFGSTTKRGGGRDLYSVVMTPDEILGLLFYPQAWVGRDWCRSPNPIDHAFAAHQHEEPDFTSWMKRVEYGFYPYHLQRMTKYLEPADDDYIACSGCVTIPAVPEEILWYLPDLGILSGPACRKLLRPHIAQWWC